MKGNSIKQYQIYLNSGIWLLVELFIISGCQQPAQSNDKMKKFKSVCDYKKDDFRLEEDVKYFSLNRLPVGKTCEYDAKTYQQLSSVEKQALKHVKKDVKVYFRLFLPPNASVIGMPPSAYISYIDMHSKVHIVTSKKELKAFLGNIDTPAEVKVWLMLNGKRPVERYEKRSVDYRAWFCGKNYLADRNGKCSYVVTPHGKITKE